MAVSGGSTGCNNPDQSDTLLDHLADAGLMAYGQTGDLASLTDRNRDRVRLIKHIAQKPEGVSQTVLTHMVLKGTNPTNYIGTPDLSGDALDRHDAFLDHYHANGEHVALDGSDDDYQFCNRFINDLSESTDLIRLEPSDDDSTSQRRIYPTLRLLDLISSGITETTTAPNDIVYDKEFCLKLLKSCRSTRLELPQFVKNILQNSLRRYIQRTNDYRLAFDVHLSDRTGHDTKRMYKPYATRFTDDGRRDRAFARLQDSLDWAADHADTAVFCTLTTDPKKFDNLLEAIEAISDNFHALNQYLATDPSTKVDTRKSASPAWSGPDCNATGRPRERLEYIKVLEFTGKGYPHLHVLYLDPPRRESDGMPWLIDKNELSNWWSKDTQNRTGQGQIVDCYPLTYCDDLDSLDAQFNADEGFVSWYRYGDHEHSQDWIENQAKYHQNQGQIDFDGSDENPMQKTAGAYIGKYLSKMYEQLVELSDLDDDDGLDDNLWKLGIYWCTEKRFWSPSRTIERGIELDQDRTDIRRGVAAATTVSLHHHTDVCNRPHACYPDIDHDKARSLLYTLSRELVASMDLDARDAAQTQTTLARVEYLGAYPYDDLPARPETTISPDVLQSSIHDPDIDLELATLADRPPPISTAFQ